jgi:hypothetical protein
VYICSECWVLAIHVEIELAVLLQETVGRRPLVHLGITQLLGVVATIAVEALISSLEYEVELRIFDPQLFADPQVAADRQRLTPGDRSRHGDDEPLRDAGVEDR